MMKKLPYILIVLLLSRGGSFAAEQTILARVTGYWPMGASNARGCGTGAVLRNGHCAVDPKHIPYGSKVVFPDAVCEAVDSGPAVVSRKSARSCGRTKAEREALVIDRFFESKAEAVRWSNAHPQFMTLRIVPPGEAIASSTTRLAQAEGPMAPAITTTPDGIATAAAHLAAGKTVDNPRTTARTVRRRG